MAPVFENQRAATVSFALNPGSHVDEEVIRGCPDVPRRPPAEAAARSADGRLVEVRPHKGARATRIGLESVVAAALLRRGLDAAVVQTITGIIDQARLKRLDRCPEYRAVAVRATQFAATRGAFFVPS